MKAGEVELGDIPDEFLGNCFIIQHFFGVYSSFKKNYAFIQLIAFTFLVSVFTISPYFLRPHYCGADARSSDTSHKPSDCGSIDDPLTLAR